MGKGILQVEPGRSNSPDGLNPCVIQTPLTIIYLIFKQLPTGEATTDIYPQRAQNYD